MWWLAWIQVDLKATKRPRISIEAIPVSFTAVSYSPFPNQLPVWCCIKWNCLLNKGEMMRWGGFLWPTESPYSENSSLSWHGNKGRIDVLWFQDAKRSLEPRSTLKVAKLQRLVGLWEAGMSAFPECFTWQRDADVLLFHELCKWMFHIFFCFVHVNFCLYLCALVKLFESSTKHKIELPAFKANQGSR